ncbi:hypothetical protein GOBAR_DD36678 [Gossypium barbadense]|nr:hypothetical protein GOBAR_DD36678 [Gossypium barbadense]
MYFDKTCYSPFSKWTQNIYKDSFNYNICTHVHDLFAPVFVLVPLWKLTALWRMQYTNIHGTLDRRIAATRPLDLLETMQLLSCLTTCLRKFLMKNSYDSKFYNSTMAKVIDSTFRLPSSATAITKDQARLQYLSSLVAKKPVVPIASGRQIVQSPTYIVRANIGTPPQTLLMAWILAMMPLGIPCTGCLGCSSTVFDNAKSTTFQSLGCQAPQCKQVAPQC